jgi:PadR family transcriptional regulator, regulatory protein PadR
MNYGRELLKGSTESLLLCMISNKAMYGYQIIKDLEQRSNGYFQFKEGTLYPALHRLEKAGLLGGTWDKLPNGQVRKYYRLTEKGRNALEERMETWRGFSSAVNLIMDPYSS